MPSSQTVPQGPCSVLSAPRSRYRSINSATPNRAARRRRFKLRHSAKGAFGSNQRHRVLSWNPPVEAAA